MTMRLPIAVLLAGLAGSVAFGSLAFGQEHQHAADQAEASQKTPSAVPAAPPLYTDQELMFLTHMIVHHQQAIDMAALVPGRSSSRALLNFARYIAGAQQAEIDQMNALLDLARSRGQSIPHHDMSGDPPMPGMLSKAQMAQLEASTGAQFERLWLEGMIVHHEAAVDMALELQQHQFETRRQPYGIEAMAEDILTGQRGEIGIMQEWLERGLP